MLGLGSRLFERQADLTAAERITQTCYYMGQATESGLQAEAVTFFGPDDLDRFVHVKDAAQKLLYKRPAGKPMGVRETDGKYINRPETIECVPSPPSNLPVWVSLTLLPHLSWTGASSTCGA